ncbi:MAG: response regulator transcription factor [Desulfococcaceae bacterium]|nr:response regulator transcription factor [Desulfococcaceae bacterium]
MKILLVDDEQELVSTLAERLAMRGFDAHWFTNGNAALQYAQKEKCDLAVLDVKMPKIGGLELQRQLAEMQPRMKFIFLTGHGSEEDYLAGTRKGHSYLIKPVDIGQLLAKINEFLRQRNQE